MPAGVRIPKILIGFILTLGIFLHLIGISQPFLGNFAQRQTDYATVVQRWLDVGINPTLPVMRFLALGQNRIFLGDFPLNVTIVSVLCQLFHFSVEFAGRGLSVFFFFLSVFVFWKLIRLFFEDLILRIWIILFYTFSPLTLIYGQAFLPEIIALCFGLCGYYFFLKWFRENKILTIVLSAAFFSLMLGTRIYFAPVLLPLAFLVFQKEKTKALLNPHCWLFLFFTLALPLFWQTYAAQAAQAHHDQSSLSDNFKIFVVADPILREKASKLEFYLPILKNLIIKVLNPMGIVLALIAFFVSGHRATKQFMALFFVCFMSLFFIAPRKFIEFEYYFLPLVPACAILAGLAWAHFTGHTRKIWLYAGMSLFLLLSLRFSLAPIFLIPIEDRQVLATAKAAQSLIPNNARVIASHGTSTSLLYYLNRDGWAFTLNDQIVGAVRNLEDTAGTAIERLERFRSQGAAYFALANKDQISTNPALFNYLNSHYQNLPTTSGLLYKLDKSS